MLTPQSLLPPISAADTAEKRLRLVRRRQQPRRPTRITHVDFRFHGADARRAPTPPRKRRHGAVGLTKMRDERYAISCALSCTADA